MQKTAQTVSQTRQQIRRHVREIRQKLTALEQHQAERIITQKALRFIERKRAENIALYLSVDGEISTDLLIDTLWKQKKSVYLPILHPFVEGHLLFLKYTPETPMIINQFNIPEPKLDVTTVLPTERLDIIFTPLVAFDAKGNRLGMGGGFYDRTLQNWRRKRFIPVGLAHRCQQVDELPLENWDIPLADILVG